MSTTERRRSQQARWAAIAAGLLAVLLTVAACGGGGDGESGFQKITASESVFEIDDFLSIGFKKNKQYKVDELPGGLDAWAGFWGLDPYSRKDYEIRFYASHDAAVELGPALAEEVTGDNAQAFRKNPTWKEGAKDRWQNAFTADLAASSLSGPSPKYGNYAIYGNILVLCEGVDSEQGLKHCEDLVVALTAGQTE